MMGQRRRIATRVVGPFGAPRGTGGGVYIGGGYRRAAERLWSDFFSNLILSSMIFGWICERG
jgi:hypothetical protein